MKNDRAPAILIVGKVNPIQGGTSVQTRWIAHALASKGYSVHLITNASSVEDRFRCAMSDEDHERMRREPFLGSDITIHETSTADRTGFHIPFAQPHLTKLIGLASTVAQDVRPKAIFGIYMEPYGLAAMTVARDLDIPLLLQHAGSDVDRLPRDPNIDSAHRIAIRQAAGFKCSSSTAYRLVARGLDPAAVSRGLPAVPNPNFLAEGPALDLSEAITRSTDDGLPPPHVGEFNPNIPTVGVYGKPGDKKGSFALLRSLDAVATAGVAFNFVAVWGTADASPMTELLDQVRSSVALARRTTILPFIAHTRVPEFLRLCKVVAFLEHDFSVKIHRPQIPKEVVACGRSLVLSKDVLSYQPREVREYAGIIPCDPRSDVSLFDALSQGIADNTDFPSISEESRLDGYASVYDTFVEESLSHAQAIVATRQTEAISAIVAGSPGTKSVPDWNALRQSLWLKRFNTLVGQTALLSTHFPDLLQRVRKIVIASGFAERSDAGWVEWFLLVLEDNATPDELEAGLHQVVEFEQRRHEALAALPSPVPLSAPWSDEIQLASGVSLVAGSINLAAAYNGDSPQLLHVRDGEVACLIVPPDIDGQLGVYAVGPGIARLIMAAETGLSLASLSEGQRGAAEHLIEIGALI